jgi:hemerythrin-like domain-containing protein
LDKVATKRPIDPIARFMQEHDVTMGHLAALNRAAKELRERGVSAGLYRRLTSAVAFLDEEVVVHNGREEQALFPVLERYVEGPTHMMRKEHRVMRLELRRLRRCVNRMQRSPGEPSDTGEISERTQSVVQLFVNHIHKENQILFPLVRKFLTKDALREIARRLV